MITNESDLLLFDDVEDDPIEEQLDAQEWKVLIVDDEPEIHSVTKLVLQNFCYEKRRLRFYSAYSAAEAATLLAVEEDIAVALVDVVMESDSAGLDLINRIRNELNNQDIRLVLRTGQPGLAPIKEVIREYDVSDYKNKTELSDVSLDTLMCASLRAYQEIMELKLQQQRLRAAISCSAKMIGCEDQIKYTLHCLRQFQQIMEQEQHTAISGIAFNVVNSKLAVMAHIGKLDYLQETHNVHELPSRIQDLVSEAQRKQQHAYSDNSALLYISNPASEIPLFYLESKKSIDVSLVEALELLIDNIDVHMENQRLHRQLARGQLQLAISIQQKLTLLQEKTSSQRSLITNIAAALGKIAGLSETQQEIFKHVIHFYDLGKLGLPEALISGLQSSENFWLQVGQYCVIPTVLKDKHLQQKISAALALASQHHENWDGSGHPLGKSGDNIHIYARLSALAELLYKANRDKVELESLQQVLEHASAQRFDPALSEKLLPYLDQLTQMDTP